MTYVSYDITETGFYVIQEWRPCTNLFMMNASAATFVRIYLRCIHQRRMLLVWPDSPFRRSCHLLHSPYLQYTHEHQLLPACSGNISQLHDYYVVKFTQPTTTNFDLPGHQFRSSNLRIGSATLALSISARSRNL